MVYGYCRISTRKQSIERQIRNIKSKYSDVIIVEEEYTGTSSNRPEWNKLYRKLKSGDTVVFDSVSRMSRNADDGITLYMQMFDNGINLEFLKEPHINTDTYKSALSNSVQLIGDDVDDILIGVNNYLKKLAAKQIRIAFEQAEKEVEDLHQRTREGIQTARLNGKQIGMVKGTKYETKKSKEMKPLILKYSRDFNGSLTDKDCMKLLGIAYNSYYKYKKELRENDRK